MSLTIIDKREYDKGQFGCTVPHLEDIGHYVVERIILPNPENTRFATQKLAQVVEVNLNEVEDSRTVTVFELSDDGQSIVSGEIPLHIDGFGHILDPENPSEEKGYLIGDAEPQDGELYVTTEGLLAPVRRIEIEQKPLESLLAQPPSQEDLDRYHG
jgi:hypothetical protein